MISNEPIEFSTNSIRYESDIDGVNGFDPDHCSDHRNLYRNLDLIELPQRASPLQSLW